MRRTALPVSTALLRAACAVTVAAVVWNCGGAGPQRNGEPAAAVATDTPEDQGCGAEEVAATVASDAEDWFAVADDLAGVIVRCLPVEDTAVQARLAAQLARHFKIQVAHLDADVYAAPAPMLRKWTSKLLHETAGTAAEQVEGVLLSHLLLAESAVVHEEVMFVAKAVFSGSLEAADRVAFADKYAENLQALSASFARLRAVPGAVEWIVETVDGRLRDLEADVAFLRSGDLCAPVSDALLTVVEELRPDDCLAPPHL